MEFATIQKHAEDFLQNFYRNLYNHHRADKPNKPLCQAYEAATIFTREIVTQLYQALPVVPDASGEVHRLLSFVVAGFVRHKLLQLDTELAEHYAKLGWPNTWAEHDALNPGYTPQAHPADTEPFGQLAQVYERRWRELNEQIASLGWPTLSSFYQFRTGIDPNMLQQEADIFLQASEERYQQSLATVEVPLTDRWQLEEYLRGHVFAACFPAAELIPTVEDTLYRFGLDVTHQPNLVLEVNHDLPQGLPLAFPVRVPQEIYVCVSPEAGIDAYENLLGLVGMVMPRLLVDPKQNWFDRRLFDPALDAAYAELFMGLVAVNAWRVDLLGDAAGTKNLQAFCELRQLYRQRLTAARVSYTVARGLSQADYVSIFQQALGVAHDASAQAIDMGHMRSAFDTWRGMRAGASFADSLVRKYGDSWYRSSECGDALRQLFSSGISTLDGLKIK